MDTLTLEKPSTEKVRINTHSLYLHNDDVHSFDFVIDALIDICKHSTHQAEQCAWIVHHNGKCAIKNGIFPDLQPLLNSLQEKELTVTICRIS